MRGLAPGDTVAVVGTVKMADASVTSVELLTRDGLILTRKFNDTVLARPIARDVDELRARYQSEIGRLRLERDAVTTSSNPGKYTELSAKINLLYRVHDDLEQILRPT